MHTSTFITFAVKQQRQLSARGKVVNESRVCCLLAVSGAAKSAKIVAAEVVCTNHRELKCCVFGSRMVRCQCGRRREMGEFDVCDLVPSKARVRRRDVEHKCIECMHMTCVYDMLSQSVSSGVVFRIGSDRSITEHTQLSN
jgi:hypothetical protein